MTTETEPMVRIVSTVCEECGVEYTVENGRLYGATVGTVSQVRRAAERIKRCDQGCGAMTKHRFATEPVR